MTLPLIQRRGTQNRSALMFHWRAARGLLTPLTGQTPTFTATTTGTADDVNGTSYTAVHSQPRWHWDSTQERPALRMTSRDQLYWALNIIPVEMTVYVEFIEQGTRTGSAGEKILHLGHQTSATTDARFYIDTTGSAYRVSHDNGSANRQVTVSGSPTTGDRVEILARLQADGGVEIEMSIDGATATTNSAGTANTLQSAWAGPYLHLNGVASSNQGSSDFLAVKLAHGDRTLAEMRTAW